MSYMQIKYDDEDSCIKEELKSTKKSEQSCLTCREQNPQSYICTICHNCSEWHR